VTTERYRPVRKVAVRVIDGKAVMITLSDSKLHRLNASATRVWEGIESGRAVSEIVAGLCAEFAVSREQAHADVTALLGELLARGIVAPADDEVVEAAGR
jgi:hypothetical protein